MPVKYFLPRAAALLIALGALAGAAAAADFAPPDYDRAPPLRLAVSAIDVDNRYSPPANGLHVESRMVVRPAAALDQWAHARLDPAGGPYHARVTIVEASMSAEKLATTPGIEGWFRREQAERFTARLKIDLRIIDAGGKIAGTVSADAEQSGTLAEGANQAKHEVLWHRLLNEALGRLDGNLRSAAATLPDFLR